MARSSAPPPPTLVLLVRHGQTPTTGKVLPGRAPGLHLADSGRKQAEAVAGRIAALQTDKRRVAAVYASPLERTRETAAPIAKMLGLRVRRAKGLLECEFGDWTGAALKKLYPLPEWRTVQRNPSGFRFPGGESFTEMQTRIGTAIESMRAAHPGETVVAVSHADPIKAAVAQAMGMHLDLFQRIVISPCSVSAILYGADGPIVLAVNSTGDLSALGAVVTSFDLPSPDVFTAGAVGPPGQRVFYLQVRDDSLTVSVRCEKQQVATLAEYFDGLLEDLEPAPYGVAVDDLELAEPLNPIWTVGAIGVAYDEASDRIVVVLEEITDIPDDGELEDVIDDDDDDEATGASVHVRLSRAQLSAFVRHSRELVAAGRPPCRFCGLPIDPDGHPCPKMN